jgi:outer membrane murein-binding lipoprotein Lpp
LSREPNINLIAAEAARALDKPVDEVEWLSQHLRRMARGYNFAEVERHLPRIQMLAKATALPAKVAEDYHHAIASYYVARGQWDKAEQEWRTLLDTMGLGMPAKLITMKWLAECRLHDGDSIAARQLLEDTLRECREGDNARATVALRLTLAKVAMHEGCIDEAGVLVAGCREWVIGHNIERHAPDVLLLEGRLAALRGDVDAAKASITAAIPLFQRQGLQRELDEALAALAAL